MERLAGYLNFLTRAIYPGRTFTRRMYAKFKTTKEGKHLKGYHHVTLDAKFKADCQTWLEFLKNKAINTNVCCPWVDWDNLEDTTTVLDFYTDASGSETSGGMGCMFGSHWTLAGWSPQFLKVKKPSIKFLELFALVAGIRIWKRKLMNSRVIIFCDNQATISMVNNFMSSCKNCMYLLRILVKTCLEQNFRIFPHFVKTTENGRANALSRGQIDHFHHLSAQMNILPDNEPESLPATLPPEKFWID